jgi:hypothetical protein
MTLRIMTLSIMTLSIMTLSTMTICNFAECYHDESRDSFIAMLNVNMLSVIAPFKHMGIWW